MKLFLILAMVLCLPVWSQISKNRPEAPMPLEFDYQPFIINNVLMIPLNDLVQKAVVIARLKKGWWQISFAGKSLEIEPNSYLARVDGKSVKMPFRTFTIYDQTQKNHQPVTYIPLRFIADFLNLPIVYFNDHLVIGNQQWIFSSSKFIVADLSEQKVYAYEGLRAKLDFRICSGKPSTPTNKGIFKTYRKWPGWHSWKATKTVPYDGKMYNAIYFDGGKAFHGSTDMRIRPSSHGCCRMFLKDSDKLYQWTPGKPGSRHFIAKNDAIPVYIF